MSRGKDPADLDDQELQDALLFRGFGADGEPLPDEPARLYTPPPPPRKPRPISNPMLSTEASIFDKINARPELTEAIVSMHAELTPDRGSELRGKCPLHNGETLNSIAVNTDTGDWRCFSSEARCGGGGPIQFVQRMHGFDRAIDAALWIADRFSIPDRPMEGAA